MMDGFITALASGPNMMMPSAMLRWIWDADNGEKSPTFANAAEAKHIIGLIIRHWNSVNDTLNNALEAYEPLILESESDGRTIRSSTNGALGTTRPSLSTVPLGHRCWSSTLNGLR